MPGEREEESQSHDPLVAIFDTQQESEAMVVQGLLESAGIESSLASRDAPQDIFPGVGGVVLRVTPDQAEEARRIIEEYRASASAEPPEPDPESSEGSAA